MIKTAIKKIIKNTVSIRPQILFESFNGAQYSDNPRAISEMIHEIYPEYKIVWHLNENANKELVPDYVSCISKGVEFYYALFSSFCYVSNCELHGLVYYKKKRQLYVQTWHADRYFKKVLYDADPEWGKNTEMCDDRVTNIALAGSDFGIKTYRDAFRYTGEIINLGCPRNEKMLNMSNNAKNNLKKRLGINMEDKIFMYAPTFRDYQMDSQNVFIDIEQTRNSIQNKFGGTWKAIVRGHVGKHLSGFKKDDDFIDVTAYPDMADLLAICDFLITDYSSSVLDFYLTGKPIILASFDIDDYEKRCRGFNIDPRDTSFICAFDQEELIKIISDLDVSRFKRDYRKLDELFGTNETGTSTKYICEYINNYYNKNFKSPNT